MMALEARAREEMGEMMSRADSSALGFLAVGNCLLNTEKDDVGWTVLLEK